MGIIDGLTAAAKTLREADKIEQYNQILEAQEKLLEQQARIAELESENRELKEKLEIKQNTIFENNSLWKINGKKKEGPYCSTCYEAKDRLVHLHSWSPGRGKCENCEKIIDIDSSLADAYSREQDRIANENRNNFDSYFT